MLNCTYKYLICRIYQREVQSFVKDGVGRLPPLASSGSCDQCVCAEVALAEKDAGLCLGFSQGGTAVEPSQVFDM